MTHRRASLFNNHFVYRLSINFLLQSLSSLSLISTSDVSDELNISLRHFSAEKQLVMSVGTDMRVDKSRCTVIKTKMEAKKSIHSMHDIALMGTFVLAPVSADTLLNGSAFRAVLNAGS